MRFGREYLGRWGGVCFDPGTILAAASFAGSAFSALGQFRAGQAQQAAGDYNAAVSRVNAEQTLQQATLQADIEAQKTRRETAQQAANFGASGVELTGSPLAVMGDTAMTGELNRQLILYRGKIGAQAADSQAAVDEFKGQQAASAGTAAAGGTLLSGGVKFAESAPGQSIIKSLTGP